MLRINPEDPYVFGPPGSGSIRTRYGFGSGSFNHQAKLVRNTLIPTLFWLLYDFLSVKNYVNVASKSNKPSWRSLTKIAGSGSVSQRYGSADQDPYQNVTDPQHWLKQKHIFKKQGVIRICADSSHAPVLKSRESCLYEWLTQYTMYNLNRCNERNDIIINIIIPTNFIVLRNGSTRMIQRIESATHTHAHQTLQMSHNRDRIYIFDNTLHSLVHYR